MSWILTSLSVIKILVQNLERSSLSQMINREPTLKTFRKLTGKHLPCYPRKRWHLNCFPGSLTRFFKWTFSPNLLLLGVKFKKGIKSLRKMKSHKCSRQIHIQSRFTHWVYSSWTVKVLEQCQLTLFSCLYR